MEERVWATFPWSALIWFIASSVIFFVLQWKGEALQQMDPESYPKRRRVLLVYSFVMGSLNMTQMVMWMQLIDFFNYIVTACLFIAFAVIEDGRKRAVARNMAILTSVLALLSLLSSLVPLEGAAQIFLPMLS